jgi:predicted RNase H-like HicB family nuclease
MSRDFDVVIERDSEGYFVASVPALPGCHTQARSLDELSDRSQEAIALYIEAEGELGEQLDLVGI